MMRLLAIAALAGLLMGPSCQPLPQAALSFSTPQVTTPVATLFSVDLVLHTDEAVQAFEIDAETDAPGVLILNAVPHAEFDDDGALFTSPVIDVVNGTAERIVDLRHGAPASGDVKLVTLYVWANELGNHQVRITATRLAGADGTQRGANTFPLDVTVTP